MLNRTILQHIVITALHEDIQTGDVTADLLPDTTTTTAYLIAKQDGVIAGLTVAKVAFELVDSTILFEAYMEEGSVVTAGQKIGMVSGNARHVLTAERTALNFLQRMSGIASKTSQFVDAVVGTNATILDTRKTAPGMRLTDKWAVRLGGGKNHRMGLYDMILIKENHISSAGSISSILTQAMQIKEVKNVPIEIEVKNLDELQQALLFDIDRIMLDNMTLDKMREAVAITAGKTKLEASGNVRLSTVRSIAETGVDYISSGALTHSVEAVDISLLHDSLRPKKVRS